MKCHRPHMAAQSDAVLIDALQDGHMMGHRDESPDTLEEHPLRTIAGGFGEVAFWHLADMGNWRMSASRQKRPFP
jgi:hypothetical protein